MNTRAWLGQCPPLRVAREGWRVLAVQFGAGFRWMGGLVRLVGFAGDYRRFKRLNAGTPFALRARDIQPCLTDRTATTPVEPTYFLQDTWCARKLAERRPAGHVDVGSSAKSMGVIAQFVPVTFVDIRPLELEVGRFSFVAASILALWRRGGRRRGIPCRACPCVP